jgi:isopentenyldiphosphate isomerase
MSQLEERFDIYDEEMNPIGTAARHEVHAQGLWHQTFQCWIFNNQAGKPALLFQKRHPNKDTFPGLLDISCAGHLQAGERVEDGNRELEEELGLNVPFDQLVPCGTYRSDNPIKPGLIDRELCHVFCYQTDQALTSYKLQEDEVTGLFRVSVEDVLRLLNGLRPGETIAAAGVEPDEQGRLQEVSRSFTAQQFVPRAADYYEMLLKTINADSRNPLTFRR